MAQRLLRTSGWMSALFLALGLLSVALGQLRPADQIAYERYADAWRDIMLLDVGSSRQLNLTQSAEDEFAPAWNLTGTHLLYRNYDSQHSEILHALDLGTLQRTVLETNTGNDETALRAAWYGNDEPYAFTVGYGQMWAGRAGTAPNPIGYGFNPVWSPNGNLVLYYADAPGELNAEVFAYDPVARRTLNLSQHQAHDWNPAWSPDGQRVAFVSGRAGSADLFMVEIGCAERQACGREAVRLTFSPQSEIGPSWSPDGQRIVFARDTASGYQLFILDIATGWEHQLTDEAANHRAPAWRP